MNAHPAAPLLKVLEGRILPRLEAGAWDYVVVARAARKLLRLPPDVRAVPLQLQGKRVAVRHSSVFDRAPLLSARWPRDAMRELRVPKLMLVTKGRAGMRMADYVLQCPENTVVFLPSGTPHSDGTASHLETLSPEFNECSLLWFTPMVSGLAARMCHQLGPKHHGARQGEKLFLHNPRLVQLFSALAEEADELCHAREAATGRDAFAHLLLAFMHLAVRDISRRHFLNQDVPPHEEPAAPRHTDSVEQAVQYILTHYARPLRLDEVARLFLMSRAQFTRKFRERTGQSFVEFLNARRMEQAKKLLCETEWTAAMIGQYTGFKSAAHFHRLFTRETGCPPIEFRQRHRNA